MKRPGVITWVLVVTELAILGSLAHEANGWTTTQRVLLGVHLLALTLVLLALYLVRTIADPAQEWPEDEDGAWVVEDDRPETPGPGRELTERRCWVPERHDSHAWVDQVNQPGGAAVGYQCFGEPVEEQASQEPDPLPGYPPEPDDLETLPCTNRRFHAAHDGCPGRSGRKKAEAR